MEKRKILVLGLALLMGMIALAPTRAGAQGADPEGWVTDWLVLGQYRNGYNDAPPVEAIRYDWLTDGASRFERTYAPAVGEVVNTAYFTPAGGPSPSNEFVANAPANGFTVPTVFAAAVNNGTILDYSTLFGQDTNGVMCYAWTYANNSSPDATDCFVGVGSDDSCQVLVNGVEVGLHQGGRGWGGNNIVQNAWPCTLQPGSNLICIKVYEGGGGFGFNLRVQTDAVTGDITGLGNAQPGLSFTTVKPGGFTLPDSVAEAYRTVFANAYEIGVSVRVRVRLERMAGAPDVTITETPPANWTISDIVASVGTANAVAGQVVWTPGVVSKPETLEYRMTPDAGSAGAKTVTGTIAYGTSSRPVLSDVTLSPPVALPPKVNLVFPGGNWGDIGTASSIPGSITYEAGTNSYVLTGSGDDVWNNADGMYAAWQPVSGNFYMEAHVEWVDTSSDVWCKAGLMVRQTMDPGSQHSFIGIRRPDNVAGREVIFQWRDTAGGASNWTGDAPGLNPVPLRVLRQGNDVYGYYNDGTAWQQAAGSPHTVTGGLTDPVFAVIFVTAHTTADTATARFTPILGDPDLRTATRDLPTTYGTAAVPVTISFDRRVAGAPLNVTEVIPAGWSATATGATVNGTTITWTNTTATSVSYSATPAGAVDKWPRYFTGRARDASGNTVQITGDSAVAPDGRAIFQEGVLPDSSYTGVDDTFVIIYGIDRDGTPAMPAVSARNMGAHTHLEEGSWDGADVTPPSPMTDHKKILIKFDLSAIPRTAVVSDATLRMYYDYQRRDDITAGVPARFDHTTYAFMLNKPFGEGRGTGNDGPWSLRGEANWLMAQHMVRPWEVPGVLGGGDLRALGAVEPSTSLYGVTTDVWVEWDFTTFVQDWVQFPTQNYGTKISQDELGTSTSGYRTGGYNFSSSEFSNPGQRPMLSVQYTVSEVLKARYWTLY